MSDQRWMLYGATGYTGKLILAEALRRGHRPILVGRSPERLATLARSHGLPWRQAATDDRDALGRAAAGVGAVVNAAGPLNTTGAPLLEAALEAGASFLDISGDLHWFEAIFARDAEIRARGVAAIPGVGFDVIPSDCLALRAASKVPGALHLDMAVGSTGGATRGTLNSMLGILGAGSRARRAGTLIEQPLAAQQFRLDSPIGSRGMMSAPMADLSTAFRSTEIPNITTYMMFPPSVARIMSVLGRAVSKLVRFPPTRMLLGGIPRLVPEGPSADTRARTRSYTWVRASDGGERTYEAWATLPNAYSITATATVLALERTLATRPVGALGPAQAYGAELLLELPGLELWERWNREERWRKGEW